MAVLISHFYNEEFLLPHWIKHHKPMFDHVVMIDYDSTDHSVAIIKELAPEWEIRTSRNQFFEEPYIGLEVQAVEREFTGWKMVLNTTEFLFHPNIHEYTKQLDEKGKRGITTTGVIMVDRPQERSLVIEPLCLTKNFGYMEHDLPFQPYSGCAGMSRSRLIHNHPCGLYLDGRHRNGITNETDAQLLLLWFGWSPFDFVKKRRLQIQTKFSTFTNFQHKVSSVYVIDEETLEQRFVEENSRSYNLFASPIYTAAYNRFRNSA